MATSFSFTKIQGPTVLCPGIKFGIYKVQLPSVSTDTGEALDLSADFNYVYGAIIGSSGAAADHGYYLNIIGTYASTGVVAGGLSMVTMWNAETAAALPAVTAATDLSAVNDMIVIVIGA